PVAPVEKAPPETAVAEAPPSTPAEPAPPPPARAPTHVAAAPRTAATPAAKQPPAATPVEREPPAAKPPASPAPIEIAALVPTEIPRYAPGLLASGPTVRIASAARSAAAAAAAPQALGPAQVGTSAHGAPSLYWFLPEASSSPVEVTVVDPDASDPVLEARFEAPLAAGVHRVSLAERGVQLRPGVDYRWFVALVSDPERRSQDEVSGAAIRYAPPDPELAARLAAAPAGHAAHVYAESGFWYDAFDQLSSWL